MKCNQDENHTCDNVNMQKCKNCTAPMLCFCTRPEVRAMVEDLWDKDTMDNEKNKDRFY